MMHRAIIAVIERILCRGYAVGFSKHEERFGSVRVFLFECFYNAH